MRRELLARLGSRDAVSWVTVAFIYPSSLLFSLFGSGVALTDESVWRITLASLVTSTVMLACLGAARFLIFRGEPADASHPELLLAAFAGALMVRAGVFDLLLLAFDLSDSSWFWYRFAASLPSTGAGLVIVALIVSLARDYNRAVERLDRTQRSFAELEGAHQALIEQERQRVIDLARVGLDERLRDLDSVASPAALASVRTAIEDVVRPLSHLLNEPSATEVSLPEAATVPVGWRNVFRGLFTRRSIMPGWYTLWFTFAGLLYAPALWGPEVGFRFVALLALMTYLACSLAAVVWNRWIAHRSWRVRACSFSVISLAVGAGYGLLSALLSTRIADNLVSHTLSLMASALLAGWVFAALVSLEYNVRLLRQNIAEAEETLHRERVLLSTSLRAEMRALARFLHGPVQDALSVAGFRIRAALDEGHASPELLAELHSSITQTIEALPAAEREATDAAEALEQLARLWEGVAQITWSLSDRAERALAERTVTRSSFNELVREATSNAIRHGQATELTIFADVLDDELVMRVRNTGMPIASEHTPGMGSKLLDELAFSWRRRATRDGTLLVAMLPLVD